MIGRRRTSTTPPGQVRLGQPETNEKEYEMNLIAEDLARIHIDARLQEARILRREHQLIAARRLSRRAERAAAQARLALARAI